MKTNVLLLLVVLFLCRISTWASSDIDSLNRLISSNQPDTIHIDARLHLASLLQSTDATAAFIHIQEAINLSHDLDDPGYLGYSYQSLGNYYFRNKNYKSALENLFLSDEYFKQAEMGRINVLNNIGLIYMDTRNYFEALAKFHEVEQLVKEENDLEKLPTIYNNFGAVYHQLEHYDLAEAYYLKAFEGISSQENPSFNGIILNNLGEIALEKGEYEKAKNHLLKSTSIQEKMENGNLLVLDYANLGMAYTYLEIKDSALLFFEKANVIGREFDDEAGILNVKCCLATYHNVMGEFDQAITISNECLSDAKERGDLMIEKKALDNLFLAYRGLGDFEKALEFNIAVGAISDSLQKGGDRFGISQLEVDFDSAAEAERLQQLNKGEPENNRSFFEQQWFILLSFFLLLGSLILILERRRSKNKELTEGSENVDYIQSTRILFLLAAILYSLLPIVIPRMVPESYDPLSQRLLISGVIIVVYLASYWWAWIRSNIAQFTQTLYIIMVVHSFFLIYANEIGIDHIFYLVVILSAVSVVFKRLSTMAVFAGFALGISILITLGVENPAVNSSIFIGVVVAMLIVSLVVAFTKVDLDKHLDFTNEAVNQADAIVFIVNRKGENIYTSQSIKNILGHDPQDFASHDWIEKLGVERRRAHSIKNNLILIAMGTLEPDFNSYQPLKTKAGETKWFSIKEKRIDRDRVLVIGLDVTVQKKVQDELANSERNFRQINETLTDVFYLYNLETNRCEYISPNSEDIMGAPPEFFYEGKSHVEGFVLEDDKTDVRNAVKMLAKGVPYEIEYRVLIKGEIFWIREKSYPVRNEDGEVIKCSGLCQDITERKRAEEEIKKLSLIASTTDNFILMVNDENRVEWANQSFYNLSGYSEEETIGKLPLELISGPLTSEKLIDEISAAVFEDKNQIRRELINYKKDESVFYSILEVTPLIGENNEVEKYFIIGSDISQRITDQEQIQKLSLVASNTSNYVLIAGTDSGIEWINESFTEKFGYSFEDVEGLFPSSFLHSDDIQPKVVEEINQTVFANKQKFSGELVHKTKSGKEVYANVNITPIVNEDGGVEKYFVLGVDITERKKNEEAIERANKELSIKERALNESEQNFRELIKSIKEVFWLANYQSDEMIFVSDSYFEVFGRTPESLKENPESWREILHPQDFDWVVASLQKNAKYGRFNEDFRIILDSGEQKWVNSRIFVINDAEGEPVKMSGFVEDITYKKEQELKIKKIADQLDIVHVIEKTILTSESTSEIIYNTLDRTIEKLPVLRASLALFDENNETFFSYAKMSGDLSSVTDRKQFDLEDFSLYEHLNKTRTNHVEDLTKKKNKSRTDEILIKEGAKLAMLSPLIHGDELIGSLNVCFTDTHQEDTEHYIEITNEVANGLAIAIYQSQLKEKIQDYNASITSSIDYAKMIQQSYIPTSLEIDGFFKDSMIINRPKDIVSGDFYWVGAHGNIKVVVVGDCTGHGVPGAFMTIIGISELSTIVTQLGITDPAEILNELNSRIIEALSTKQGVQLKDGMDVGVFCYDTDSEKAYYAGARRPLYQLSKGVLTMVNGTRLSIGDTGDDFGMRFETTQMEWNKDDQFYIFSDGCTDQFGGERLRKFSRRRLDDLILGHADDSFNTQREAIENALANWQGSHFQTDDILLVGFKV